MVPLPWPLAATVQGKLRFSHCRAQRRDYTQASPEPVTEGTSTYFRTVAGVPSLHGGQNQVRCFSSCQALCTCPGTQAHPGVCRGGAKLSQALEAGPEWLSPAKAELWLGSRALGGSMDWGVPGTSMSEKVQLNSTGRLQACFSEPPHPHKARPWQVTPTQLL